MIASFHSRGDEDIFNGRQTRAPGKTLPANVHSIARRKLDQMNAAPSLGSLAVPPGNELEPLHGDRLGQYSIRINKKYRICFRWTPTGPAEVEITDYH